ncbi:MAG: hypothetical protein U9N34_11470, partial [Candidatus Cloacimonadota bacterium]|nr:hypothetical protein [Candidatus Cloacimonadota bacterium]
MKKLLFVLTALVLLLSSCEELLEADLEPEDYLFEGVSMVETDDPDFDYIVNDEDGNMVYFSWNENYVTNVICRNTDEDWVEIEFNSSAIPEYIYSNDYIVMIDNYLDGVADFAV